MHPILVTWPVNAALLPATADVGLTKLSPDSADDWDPQEMGCMHDNAVDEFVAQTIPVQQHSMLCTESCLQSSCSGQHIAIQSSAWYGS